MLPLIHNNAYSAIQRKKRLEKVREYEALTYGTTFYVIQYLNGQYPRKRNKSWVATYTPSVHKNVAFLSVVQGPIAIATLIQTGAGSNRGVMNPR